MTLARQRADKKARQDLFKETHTSFSQNINWAIDYTSLAYSIKKVVLKHWHILSDVPGCNNKPFIGFRKTATIKDLLVHADLKVDANIENSPNGHFRCLRCAACPLSWETKCIEFSDINFKWVLKSYSSCATKRTIYMVVCPCGLRYIGESMRAIKTRILEHKSKIKHAHLDAPLVDHFVSKGHRYDDFKFVVLEVIKTNKYDRKDIRKVLLKREAFWIYRLNTIHPHGLNASLDLSCFL